MPPRLPAPAHGPQPAYTELPVDKDFYLRLAFTADSESSRAILRSFTIPPRSGKAWHVPAGCIFRLTTPEGPQVGDLNVWAWGKDESSEGRDGSTKAEEKFWAARTRQLNGAHVRIFDRLWSNLPFLRPLCTMIANSLEGWTDDHGSRCHDLLGTRCDPYVSTLLTSSSSSYTCHSNLTRAILPFGLPESSVHDVLNVFQATGLDGEGRYYMAPSPAKAGDYIEFFAETDILCALSTCPGGDLSAWGWQAPGDDRSVDERMKETCRPIRVDVWRVAKEVGDNVLGGWTESRTVDYRGMHGIQLPAGDMEGS